MSTKDFEIPLSRVKDVPIYLCTCGKSAKYPNCDGSHKGTDFKPLKISVTDQNLLVLAGKKGDLESEKVKLANLQKLNEDRKEDWQWKYGFEIVSALIFLPLVAINVMSKQN
jgi:CDGSH-type Zn-finger protein